MPGKEQSINYFADIHKIKAALAVGGVVAVGLLLPGCTAEKPAAAAGYIPEPEVPGSGIIGSAVGQQYKLEVPHEGALPLIPISVPGVVKGVKDCAGCHILETSPGSTLATGEPGVNNYPAAMPGQSKVLERPYPGAPPLIPHSVAGTEVSRERNDCLACHKDGVQMSPGHTATKIHLSHLEGGAVAGRFYNCLQCHVIQSDEQAPEAEEPLCPRLAGRS